MKRSLKSHVAAEKRPPVAPGPRKPAAKARGASLQTATWRVTTPSDDLLGNLYAGAGRWRLALETGDMLLWRHEQSPAVTGASRDAAPKDDPHQPVTWRVVV